MKYSLRTLYLCLLISWTDHTHHGRQSDVVRASLIPHSNRQLVWEYLWGEQKCYLRVGWGTPWVETEWVCFPGKPTTPCWWSKGLHLQEAYRNICINHIHESDLTLRVAYPRISRWKDFCLWWCDFQKPSHCASFQGRDWCDQPKREDYQCL